MKFSFYRKKLKNTEWSFEFCFLLPKISINNKLENYFQQDYANTGIYLPTNFIVDYSPKLCYIEIRLLGFGFTYHFFK